MNRLLAFALALALAAPTTALTADASASRAAAAPADDAQCDTCDAIDLMLQGQFRRGRHILEMRAAKGDVSAVTGLGLMYQNGWGVPVDYDRAMGLYQTAAHSKDLLALNQIGYLFLYGLGRPSDPKAAWCWFEQAAESGFDRSTQHLAEIMAAGIQPVSCKPSGATVADAMDLRRDQGGVSGTGLELWNGVREGMTPDQIALVLPAPYREVFATDAPSGRNPNSDVVIAPAALLGHPAIANVTFADHAAFSVVLNIDPQSDDPEQNLSLARAIASQFDAAYGHSIQRADQNGGVIGAWRSGDLAIRLSYFPLPDQPPGFSVLFMRYEPNRSAPPFPPAIVAGGQAGQGG